MAPLGGFLRDRHSFVLKDETDLDALANAAEVCARTEMEYILAAKIKKQKPFRTLNLHSLNNGFSLRYVCCLPNSRLTSRYRLLATLTTMDMVLYRGQC